MLISTIAAGAVTIGARYYPRATARAGTPQVIAISARKFEFSPSEVTLKKGVPVTLQFTSLDRTHGFLVKALGIDTDIPAGKTLAVTVTPGQSGTFPAICDHYCGAGHGGMKMTVVVE